MKRMSLLVSFLFSISVFPQSTFSQSVSTQVNELRDLPTSKRLGPVPGDPRRINALPEAMVISPDKRYAVTLNAGLGMQELGQKQSLSVLDLKTNELREFPDARLKRNSRQTYFMGLAFSADGAHLYASFASTSDPLGEKKDSTGNGI